MGREKREGGRRDDRSRDRSDEISRFKYGGREPCAKESRQSLGPRNDKERDLHLESQERIRTVITNALGGMISGHQPLSAKSPKRFLLII